MHTGSYYQSHTGTSPKTPGSASKSFYPRLGRANSPPFIPGYFTPPDSRENSPSLGGTSPNPQGQNIAIIPQLTPDGSPTPSNDTTSSLVLQREGSVGSLQSAQKPVGIEIPPVFHLSGFQSTQGTFGRADSRRYQKHAALVSPPQSAKTTQASNHQYKSSYASAIAPLPSTVYVPGIGDTSSSVDSLGIEGERGSYHNHRRERSVSDPTAHFPPIYHSPPPSVKSPSMSSPFLPIEPDTPVMPTRHALRPYNHSPVVSSQAELIGLWKSAQRGKKMAGNLSESGRIYALNMYRQAPVYKSQMLEHPLEIPENFIFGPNAETPFYTIHAMRENPEYDTFNELSFLRRDPISGLDTSVITLGLESPLPGIPPTGDGLIALIYPKAAVLSAMSPITPIFRDDSGEVLSPRRIRGNEEKAQEAIQKAYATECCRLSWDAQRKRYYLYHPGVADGGDAYLVDIEGEVGFDHLEANGTIKLINVDTNEALTELDFGRNMLFIDTRATSKIPSDHIVDVVVAAILTVATVEGRRMRMVRIGQSQSPGSAMSRSIGHDRKKERRGCFSKFLKSLGF